MGKVDREKGHREWAGLTDAPNLRKERGVGEEKSAIAQNAPIPY